MGIPINGTITQFQNKLFKKGFKIHPLNSIVPSGTRSFSGYFIGKECSLAVYYNKNTQKVYACRVLIYHYTEEQQSQSYTDLKNMLTEKYDSSYTVYKEDKAFPMEDLAETGDKWNVTETIEDDGFPGIAFPGDIVLWKFIDDRYTIMIDYQDGRNSYLNVENLKNDL